MPHMILTGCRALAEAAPLFDSKAQRWGRAVMKQEAVWLRNDRQALMVEGVVVEFSRALHPLAYIAPHHDDFIVRLRDHSPVERTDAIQRWLSTIALTVLRSCGGRLKTTNIPSALWADLNLPE